MPGIADFLDMMSTSVTIEYVTGLDMYGKPTFGPPITFKARVTFKATRIPGKVPGQDQVAAGTIWLGGVLPLGMGQDAQVTLADGQTPKVLDFGTEDDEKGPLYSFIHFG